MLLSQTCNNINVPAPDEGSVSGAESTAEARLPSH